MKEIVAVLIALLVLPSVTLAGKPVKVNLKTMIETETQERINADNALGDAVNDNTEGINTNTNAIAALSAGSGVKIYDNNNNYIGELITMGDGSGRITVYIPSLGKFVNFYGNGQGEARVAQGGTNGAKGSLFYETIDCTGQKYIRINGLHTWYFVHAIRTAEDWSNTEYYVIDKTLYEGISYFGKNILSVEYFDDNSKVFVCEPYNNTVGVVEANSLQLPPEFTSGIPFNFR